MKIAAFETALGKREEVQPVNVLLHHGHVQWFVCRRNGGGTVVFDRMGHAWATEKDIDTDVASPVFAPDMELSDHFGVLVGDESLTRVRSLDLF